MRAIVACLLLACGGSGTDIQGTLVFADRSDAEIARLMTAGTGADLFGVQSQLGYLSDSGDPCPTVTIEGTIVSITGGCTTADGLAVDGSATIDNPLGFDAIEYDFGRPTVYEASELSIEYGAGNATIYDGYVRVEDSFTTIDGDVNVTQVGIEVRSDLVLRCSNPSAPSCSTNGGIELVGEGGAIVSGHTEIDADTGASTADYTLRGVDVLTIHIEGGCTEWSIEGTERGMACP